MNLLKIGILYETVWKNRGLTKSLPLLCSKMMSLNDPEVILYCIVENNNVDNNLSYHWYMYAICIGYKNN